LEFAAANYSGEMNLLVDGGMNMSKAISVAVLITAISLGAPAWALESFTCTFGDSRSPCHQLKGQTCQKQFAPDVYATCGNIEDGFVCLFAKQPLTMAGNKASMLKSSATPSGYAFAMNDPGAGNLTLAYKDYVASCDISQTK
jgi:hypothetical protein